MDRLTIEKCGELLIKNGDEEYRSPCFGCESINKCNPEKMTCGFYKALKTLKEYEDLEERLDKQFNGCIRMETFIDSIIEYDKQSERNEELAEAVMITNP